MDSKTTGSSSLELLNALSGELIELSSRKIALDLAIPLRGIERRQQFSEVSQVLPTQLLDGFFQRFDGLLHRAILMHPNSMFKADG